MNGIDEILEGWGLAIAGIIVINIVINIMVNTGNNTLIL